MSDELFMSPELYREHESEIIAAVRVLLQNPVSPPCGVDRGHFISPPANLVDYTHRPRTAGKRRIHTVWQPHGGSSALVYEPFAKWAAFRWCRTQMHRRVTPPPPRRARR